MGLCLVWYLMVTQSSSDLIYLLSITLWDFQCVKVTFPARNVLKRFDLIWFDFWALLLMANVTVKSVSN